MPLEVVFFFFSALFSCNFDQSSICGMEQDTRDQFDWKLGQGRTPSGQLHINDNQKTGPTGGQGSSQFYIFIETSDPRVPGDQAR